MFTTGAVWMAAMLVLMLAGGDEDVVVLVVILQSLHMVNQSQELYQYTLMDTLLV